MLDTLVKNFNSDFKKFINNNIIYALMALFFAMYGPRLQPKLPEFLNKLFNNNYFRFCVILLIAYLSNKNLELSLIITIGFCLIMSLANSYDIKEKFKIDYNENNENYADYGIITSKEDYLPNNEPDDLDTQILKIESENNIDNLDENIKIPEECNNEVYNQACINYCYSSAGFNDEFCNKKFPQPEIKKLKETFQIEETAEPEIPVPETPAEAPATYSAAEEAAEATAEVTAEETDQPIEEEEIIEKYESNPKQISGLENISYSYLDNNILNGDEVNESFMNYFDNINNNVNKQINIYKNPLS